jgi:hypothetical protein
MVTTKKTEPEGGAASLSFPVTRTLLHPHTHAGKKHKAGDEIIITDAPTYQFLVQRRIVEE